MPPKKNTKTPATQAAADVVPDLDESTYPDLDDNDLAALNASMSGDSVPQLDSDEESSPPFDVDDGPDISGMPDGIARASQTHAEGGLVLARLESIINASSDYHNLVMNRLESIVPTVKSLSDAVGGRLDGVESAVDQLRQQQASFGQLLGKTVSLLERLVTSTAAPSDKPEKPEKPEKPAKAQPSRVHTGATSVDVAQWIEANGGPAVAQSEGNIIAIEKVLSAMRGGSYSMTFESFVSLCTDKAKMSLQVAQGLVRAYALKPDERVTSALFK